MELISQKEKDAINKIRPLVKGYLGQLLVGFIVIINLALAFWALYPRVDQAQVEAGEKRLDALNITFSSKTLNALKQTKTPVDLNASGGRDPFSNF